MAGVSKRTWKTSSGAPRHSWQVDYADETGARQRKQFKLKKDADAFRIKVEGGLADGTYRSKAEGTTVRDVALAYLEHAGGRNERGERSTKAHPLVVTGHIHNYICPNPEHRAKRKVKTQVREFVPVSQPFLCRSSRRARSAISAIGFGLPASGSSRRERSSRPSPRCWPLRCLKTSSPSTLRPAFV